MERAKAFEVRKQTSSNKTIRMPDELIGRLEDLAKDKDVSFNKLVVQCCEFALANLKEDHWNGE